MSAETLVDICLYLGIALWLVGFVIRVVDRRRTPASDTPPKVRKTKLDGFMSESAANDRPLVTVLLAAGVVMLIAATAISWLYDTSPRAPEAAAEIEAMMKKDSS